MKKTVALIISLVLVMALPLGAQAEADFYPDMVTATYDILVRDFLSDDPMVALLELEAQAPVKKLDGVSVYRSVDNHIVFISKDMVYSYADLSDASTTKNVGQLFLGLTVPMAIPADYLPWDGDRAAADADGDALLTWLNDSSDGDVFVGETLDVYCYQEPHVKRIQLFVPHGQNINELKPLIKRMNKAIKNML